MASIATNMSFSVLKFVSADSLSIIASYLSGYDLAMLWFTGDRNIRRLMSDKSVVRHFSTNFETPTKILNFVFPRLLSHFTGLDSLTLSLQRRYTLNSARFNFSGLPATLQTLKLVEIDVKPFLSWLEHAHNPLPLLKEFISTYRSYEWTATALALLPRSLERVKVTYISNLEDVVCLGPNLASLSVNAAPDNLEPISWAPTLTKLKLKLIDGGILFGTKMGPFNAALPRTLEWLEVTDGSGLYQCIHELPPSITHLVLSCVDLDNFTDWKTCFPNLAHIELRLRQSVSAHIISLLPPSLKYLSIRSIDSDSVSGVLDTLRFPPALEHLITCQWMGKHVVDLIPRLPQTLKTISIPFRLDRAQIASLPRSITSLDLLDIQDGLEDVLPPKLTSLASTRRFFLKENSIRALPRTITSLRIIKDCNMRVNTLSQHLPLVSFTKHAIGTSNDAISYIDFVSLGSTLLHLKMLDVAFQPKKYSVEFWKTSLSKTQLISLKLHGKITGTFSNYSKRASIDHLIDPNILLGLPNTLRRLELRYFRDTITDEHISALPKLIADIDIKDAPDCTISDVSIPLWPKYINLMYWPKTSKLTYKKVHELAVPLLDRAHFGHITLRFLFE